MGPLSGEECQDACTNILKKLPLTEERIQPVGDRTVAGASGGREVGLLGAYVGVALTGCDDGLNMKREGNGGTWDPGLANHGGCVHCLLRQRPRRECYRWGDMGTWFWASGI